MKNNNSVVELLKTHFTKQDEQIDRPLDAPLWLQSKILSDHSENKVQHVDIGRFYLFSYDAKYKDILPYWDIYPCIVVIEKYNNGFLGLNMHYLPPKERMLLFTYIAPFYKRIFNKSTVNASYKKISAFAYYAKATVKRYLYSHINSLGVIELPSREWKHIVQLPLAYFKNASKQHVYFESLRVNHGKY